MARTKKILKQSSIHGDCIFRVVFEESRESKLITAPDGCKMYEMTDAKI